MYEKYLQQLEEAGPRGILFPNKFTGNYLTVSTLEQVMRRAVSDAELPTGATPHCLRHILKSILLPLNKQKLPGTS